ncbi:CNB_1a_G0043800.mRNA.1.CDS.1 [Saccharomyces cerevisiae]|nr:CNB_1a_G0043800.mRNA.1.CDS.1 [Saccharomyces cerevisiae]CAI7437173.1 CNB_1a_G0043800.mRNA.1.CDS.1 [Saccharomyces cerevisiae]
MFIPAKSTSLRNEVHFETMLFECIERSQNLNYKNACFRTIFVEGTVIPHFTQEFLTGGWIFFKTRRLPVLDVRECAYCVISDSAPRKEILACSDL